MDIHLFDLSQEMCDSWTKHFSGITQDRIKIHHKDFRELEDEVQFRSALVSPANSFGFMDGGIDGAYTKHFGPELQARVQEKIKEKYEGELLVGQALAVPIDPSPHGRGFNYLISAPTMRVPLLINQTPNVFLATRALFRTCSRIGVDTVAIPGMGTGVGAVSFDECAKAMRRAYDMDRGHLSTEDLFPKSIGMAVVQHTMDCTINERLIKHEHDR